MPELNVDASRFGPGRPDRSDRASPDRPDRADRPDIVLERAPAPPDPPAVGTSRGNKQEVPLHLPRVSYEALAAQADRDAVSRGVAVMRALRATYSDLARDLAPPGDTGGPFPAERRTRRRVRVEQAVRTSISVWPDEATALARVADEFDLSCSELVTLAIDRHLRATDAPA